MTDRFEHRHPGDRSLSRAKLSQNKAVEVAENVIEHVDESNPGLAREMRRVRDQRNRALLCSVSAGGVKAPPRLAYSW